MSSESVLITVRFALLRRQLLQYSWQVPIALHPEIGYPGGTGDQRHEMKHLQRREIGAEWEDVLVPLEAVVKREPL